MSRQKNAWVPFLVLASAASAQNPVDDAVAWLESVQNPSGSWGSTFELVDTATVVETLSAVGAEGTPLDDGADWLNGETAANHQHLARQIEALAGVAGFEGAVVPLALGLLGVRNPVELDGGLPNWPEGGWGVAPGFGTDCMSSALSLTALADAGLAGGTSGEDVDLPTGNNVHEWDIASDATKARILITVSGATVRLRMKQGSIPTNLDPFFSLDPGTYLIVFPDSGLPFTPGHNFIKLNATGSPATYSFTASYETPDLDTRAFAEALDYLEESQNGDGGWGLQRGGTTDLYTSLHVLLALQDYPGYDLDDERAAGLAYVLGEQLAGGGFGFDGATPLSHVTALAALNLARSETYPFSTETDAAISALAGLQDMGGSWEFLEFHTALAVRALWEHNQAPTADAGSDQAVLDADDSGSETVLLSGSGSDVDGSITSHSWTEAGVEIATGAMPSVPFTVGVHDVVLTVTDDGGRTGTDSVLVTVNGFCGSVTGLSCTSLDELGAGLGWTNVGTYSEIRVYRDAGLIAVLDGAETGYLDADLPTGTYMFGVEGICSGSTPPATECILEHTVPCPSVTDLACASGSADVDLSWSVGETYDAIHVYRDAQLIANLSGAATSFTDPDLPDGEYTYTVEAVCPADVLAPGVSCTVNHTNVCDRTFVCTSKISSAGCRPTLQSSGVPSLTGADDFFVDAGQVLGDTTGFFLWSPRGNGPGGGGPDPNLLGPSPLGARLCVSLPTAIPTGSSGGTPGACDGSFSFHFTQALMASSGLMAGDVVFAQYVFRDPTHPDGSGLAHTRALRFTICP